MVLLFAFTELATNSHWLSIATIGEYEKEEKSWIFDCPLGRWVNIILLFSQRERGLLVLQYFINKLDSHAKHRLFRWHLHFCKWLYYYMLDVINWCALMLNVYLYRCMLKISQHSGIEGYIIKNIKNQVEFSLKVRQSKSVCPHLLSCLVSLGDSNLTDHYLK